ncbi:hypothetical protein [Mycobacterium sp. 3-98]|nr:hypothetical protein [Mycobacterium sp. 3-98]WSE46436.1 hypothetical protein QGN30_00200 [Mycobacterium sp. 3-98]
MESFTRTAAPALPDWTLIRRAADALYERPHRLQPDEWRTLASVVLAHEQ